MVDCEVAIPSATFYTEGRSCKKRIVAIKRWAGFSLPLISSSPFRPIYLSVTTMVWIRLWGPLGSPLGYKFTIFKEQSHPAVKMIHTNSLSGTLTINCSKIRGWTLLVTPISPKSCKWVIVRDEMYGQYSSATTLNGCMLLMGPSRSAFKLPVQIKSLNCKLALLATCPAATVLIHWAAQPSTETQLQLTYDTVGTDLKEDK